MSATFAGPKPTLESLLPALAAFGRSHPAIERIALFGSVARGEAVVRSDVDLVVRFVPGSLPQGPAGFDLLSGLEKKLAAYLGHPVNLVEQSTVEKARRAGGFALPYAVDQSACVVYEARAGRQA